MIMLLGGEVIERLAYELQGSWFKSRLHVVESSHRVVPMNMNMNWIYILTLSIDM